jgi:hypothetical protein
MALKLSSWHREYVGVFFGLRPKNTPTFTPYHGKSKSTVKIQANTSQPTVSSEQITGCTRPDPKPIRNPGYNIATGLKQAGNIQMVSFGIQAETIYS